MGKNDRFVVKRQDGWAVKKPGAERASSLHNTQREAERAAKEIVSNLGGGEVRIQDQKESGEILIRFLQEMTHFPQKIRNIEGQR